MIAEANVEFVYVQQMIVDGEVELMNVYRNEKDCIDSARDIADYAGLLEDEGSDGYSWSDDNGACLWIERKEIL